MCTILQHDIKLFNSSTKRKKKIVVQRIQKLVLKIADNEDKNLCKIILNIFSSRTELTLKIQFQII